MSAAPGSQSIMRFAFANIIVMDYIILAVWIIASINQGKVTDIGPNIADFAGFINAAGFIGKAGQSYVESRRQNYSSITTITGKRDEGEAD
jgi:alkylated DNA nucleotide flippase Atl1